MKLSVAYIFLPAQELTVRVAAPTDETARQPLPPIWDGQCGPQTKRRWRAKYRREVLQMEAA